jgi:hypothetical protein
LYRAEVAKTVFLSRQSSEYRWAETYLYETILEQIWGCLASAADWRTYIAVTSGAVGWLPCSSPNNLKDNSGVKVSLEKVGLPKLKDLMQHR